ncbi:hypothetical protein JCM8097_002524 [Rhodosporidiobolus ruineniae]
MAEPAASPALPRYIDIGSNLGDPMFRGVVRDKQAHPDDFDQVLLRARKAGVGMQLLTGDCLEGSKEVLELANKHKGLYATVGCHPCRATEMDAYPGGVEAYIEALDKVIMENKGKAVAVGECGLDYDRLFHAPKDVQLKNFPPQLELASKHDLPLFLHSRAAHSDFVSLLKAHGKPLRGVVHSHTGTAEEALELIELGYFVGINGCSLKTQENLDCVKALPLDKMLIETDAPWCSITSTSAAAPLLATLSSSPSHAHLAPLYIPPSKKKERWAADSMVKGRNEPCTMGQVAWVVAQLKGVSVEEVAEATRRNTLALFKGMKEQEGVWPEDVGDDPQA